MGGLVTAGRLLTSPAKKFIDQVIDDRATVIRFKYTRIYALGLSTLCDVFLPTTCLDAVDAQATRAALCFALGLDAAQVDADAAALRADAATYTSRDALLASADLQDVATAERFKYTYAFGVGLVLLMRQLGEERIASEGRGYGSDGVRREGAIDVWCAALNLKYAQTLERDTERPLSIEGVGRFAFALPPDGTPGLEPPRDLESEAQGLYG